ncbi:hypothetical protein [Nonomuraea sp. SYSU D8015]|nr:hypothetical protein [Nonomuraea sp. SYSU D8015]
MSTGKVFGCSRCRGAGWVPSSVFDPRSVRGWRRCSSCNGTGKAEAKQ